jgi:hypothetical protein
MRREQPRKTPNTTRVTVPLSPAFYQSAIVGVVMERVIKERLIDYVVDKIKLGQFDEYYATDDPNSEFGMTLSIRIGGSWHHLEFFKLGEAD